MAANRTDPNGFTSFLRCVERYDPNDSTICYFVEKYGPIHCIIGFCIVFPLVALYFSWKSESKMSQKNEFLK